MMPNIHVIICAKSFFPLLLCCAHMASLAYALDHRQRGWMIFISTHTTLDYVYD
jgi:hypothetical protein